MDWEGIPSCQLQCFYVHGSFLYVERRNGQKTAEDPGWGRDLSGKVEVAGAGIFAGPHSGEGPTTDGRYPVWSAGAR